jgi:endonuclease/exonuclease/phosphatase family metal-dependent hydrolase
MMRFVRPACAAAALSAAILFGPSSVLWAQGPAAAGAEPALARLRIGTWNLEHLGQHDNARTDDDFRKIAAFILDLDVAVLAVQEVAGPEPLARLVGELNARAAPLAGAPSAATAPPFQFVLGTTGGFGDGTGRISVGFLWDDRRVELCQAEELLQLPRERDGLPIFHRVPVAAVFRARAGGTGGGLDFRAITVHLKASRGTTNDAKRKAEVQSLLAYIGELHAKQGEDRDILVLGDFNHGYGSPAHAAFTANGLVRYLRTDGDPPTIVHFAEPIDHLAITEDGLDLEVVPASRRVHDELLRELGQEAWRATYSDHLPVTVDLIAELDRDPQARFSPAGAAQELLPGSGAAAAAQPVSPGPAPGAPPAADAFPVGCQVTVTYRGFEGEPERQQKGTLREPLGDWVVIDAGSDGVLAFPAARVVCVHRP